MVGVGEITNASGFRYAASPCDVEHDDASRVHLKNIPVSVPGEKPLTHGLRYPRLLSKPAQIPNAVGLDDVLDPQDVVRLKGMEDSQRGIDIPPRMTLDDDLHLIADSVSNLLNPRYTGLEVSR